VSELTDHFNEATAARFTAGALAPRVLVPSPEFDAAMADAAAHHECPEKRVKGWCGHAVHD